MIVEKIGNDSVEWAIRVWLRGDQTAEELGLDMNSFIPALERLYKMEALIYNLSETRSLVDGWAEYVTREDQHGRVTIDEWDVDRHEPRVTVRYKGREYVGQLEAPPEEWMVDDVADSWNEAECAFYSEDGVICRWRPLLTDSLYGQIIHSAIHSEEE